MKCKKNDLISMMCILLIMACAFIFVGCGNSETNETTSQPEKVEEQEPEEDNNKVVEVASVDEILTTDDYIGKTIKVKGLVNYEDAATKMMKMYGETSGMELYLIGSEKYEMPESWCAVITGVVNKDEYGAVTVTVDSLEGCTDESCSHNGMMEENSNQDYGLTFEDKQLACERYTYMNWPQFYQYPESYDDGQLYYIVGKVVTADSDGTGLVQLVEGDNRTIVQYVSYDESLMLYENELVAFYGTISGSGSFTYTDTGEVVSCPRIYVEEFVRPNTEIYSYSEDERDFLFTSYVNTDGYFGSFPGESFTLTDTELGGYNYTVNSVKYSFGTVLTSSYDVHSNRMRINMNITLDRDGEQQDVLLMFNLDGSEMKYEPLDGDTDGYYVRQN